MGYLHYGGNEFRMDDRTLVHVQLAVHEASKRADAFFLTWPVPRHEGAGRISARITPSVPLLFRYEGSRTPHVNRSWVLQLIRNAEGASGLVVTVEIPEAPPPAAG